MHFEEKPSVFLFADYQVDLRTGELSRGDERLDIQNRSLQVLGVLLRQPGALVTREELRRALWGDDVVVEFDNNLNAAVNRLRRVLGDSAEQPRYIETLPGRGYRFIAELRPPGRPPISIEAGTGTASRSEEHARPVPTRFLCAWIAAVLLLSAAIVFGVFVRSDRVTQVLVLAFDNVSGDPAQEYIGRGIAEQLRARIDPAAGSVQVLVPADRPDADPFSDARRLNADYVLRGSAQLTPAGLHVTALLIDARTQKRVWSGAYTCPRRDLGSIETQLASKISQRLTARLLGASAP